MYKFCALSGNNSYLIKNYLLQREVWIDIGEDLEKALEQADFIWKPTNLPRRIYSRLNEIMQKRDNKPLVFNHLEENTVICTKTGLIKTLKAFYSKSDESIKCSYHAFESLPTSFIITIGSENEEYQNFLDRFKNIKSENFFKEHVPSKHCASNFWIIKPAFQNQGRGIALFNSLKEIQYFFGQKTIGSEWLVQKYIEKPLLYNNRKFDIRVWVVYVDEKVYFYQRGYIRTSSDDYSLKNMNNYIHLTNNCLQKFGDNYSKHEDGNTLSFENLNRFFKDRFPQFEITMEKDVVPRMIDIIIDTFMASKNILNPKKRNNCFELFGYDFLIDEDLRTWLIEINTNPYFGLPNAFINDLLPKMIHDMLNIILDSRFCPSEKFNQTYDAIKNEYLLVYSESNPIKNLRRSYDTELYPIREMAQLPNKFLNIKKLEEMNGTRKILKPIEHKKKSILSEVKLIFEAQSIIDYEHYTKAINKILTILENSIEKDMKEAFESLMFISESKLGGVLAERSNLERIIKILSENTISITTKIQLLDVFKNVCRIQNIKLKLLNSNFLNELMKIFISSCAKSLNENENLLFSAFELFLNILSGDFNNKFTVPGEMRAARRRKIWMIDNSCLIVAIFMKISCNNDRIKTSKPLEKFIEEFDCNDLDYQIKQLEQQSEKHNENIIKNGTLFNLFDNYSFLDLEKLKSELVNLKEKKTKASKMVSPFQEIGIKLINKCNQVNQINMKQAKNQIDDAKESKEIREKQFEQKIELDLQEKIRSEENKIKFIKKLMVNQRTRASLSKEKSKKKRRKFKKGKKFNKEFLEQTKDIYSSYKKEKNINKFASLPLISVLERIKKNKQPIKIESNYLNFKSTEEYYREVDEIVGKYLDPNFMIPTYTF